MQSAIAATPAAAWKGYLLGGILWFAVPFTLATSLGIAAVALDLPISTDEANMGLVAVASASVSTPTCTSDADLHDWLHIANCVPAWGPRHGVVTGI